MTSAGSDQGFPFIRYEAGQQPRDWGHAHGAAHAEGIQELAAIRRDLMQNANPSLVGDTVTGLAKRQWEITRSWSPRLAEEIEGISEGANVPIEDLVILNNYTDFRDINPSEHPGPAEEKGCSTLFLDNGKQSLAGQTWDMHGTAKKYVCVIEVPAGDEGAPLLLFSLVGCVGLMGFNGEGRMVGVNNLNTVKARPGVLWPVLVRETLLRHDRDAMEHLLREAPVTSGHNYLVADAKGGTHWEISPTVRAAAGSAGGKPGFAFHTNHCLTPPGKEAEMPASLNSTTHVRYGLLEKKLRADLDYEGVYRLLTDHEGYPKSICSHFQSAAKDPSYTCGGALAEMRSGQIRMWRGCPALDENYVEREYTLKNGGFTVGPVKTGIRPDRAGEVTRG